MVRTIEALEDGRLQDRLAGWLLATGLAVFAFLIRVHNLGFPAKIVFDETYYAKDAWGLLHSGYERQWLANKPFNTDAKIADGDLSGFTEGPAAVVHPPLGKWLIAIGEHFFGMTPFGWRISACVFGALLVLLTVRLARACRVPRWSGALPGC